MLKNQENERVTRVGPGTPMGEVFRRYWIPALLSEELPGPDGAPRRVRLLGEDLIAFRDSNGAVGLVDAFCPHRRAPMFFGRNEECGLRCVYHGWKFDRHGTCVDMPSEPADSLFKTKVTIAAYPTHEAGGFVWAYLGPAATIPPPPDYEFCRVPETHRHVSKTLERCNYLQALEGGLDSAHAGILHARHNGDMSFLANFERIVPRLDVERTDYGYHYAAIRTLGDIARVRIKHFLMPATQLRGQGGSFPGEGPRVLEGHHWIPMDDERTYTYNFMYAYDPATPLPRDFAAAYEAFNGRGPDVLPDFSLPRNLENDYLIDREREKSGSFCGVAGLNTQDFAVQEGMGPILDRSKEHLGTTDRCIIVARELLLEATRDVECGKAPRGVASRSARTLRPVDVRIPSGSDWRAAIPAELIAKY